MRAKQWIVGVVAAAVAFSAAASAAAPMGPVTWPVNGHSYEAVYAGRYISWYEASEEATDRGGYLACITTPAENAFVYGLLDDAQYWGPSGFGGFGPWIGAYQYDKLAEPAGHWAWVSGEPWTFPNWSPGEPSNSENQEDFAHFFSLGYSRSSTWNDQYNMPIAGTVQAYVVEYAPVPEPPVLGVIGAGAAALAVYSCRHLRRWSARYDGRARHPSRKREAITRADWPPFP